MKQDDYFWVNFYHFWIKHYFLKVGSSLKPNHHREIQFAQIRETLSAKFSCSCSRLRSLLTLRAVQRPAEHSLRPRWFGDLQWGPAHSSVSMTRQENFSPGNYEEKVGNVCHRLWPFEPSQSNWKIWTTLDHLFMLSWPVTKNATYTKWKRLIGALSKKKEFNNKMRIKKVSQMLRLVPPLGGITLATPVLGIYFLGLAS